MADYVDGLTDAELRTKLAEFGFPVVPITTTTRKVMAKKLKLLIENKNKVGSNDRRSLAKYSSGEDSDVDVGDAARRKDRNRRATVGGAMLPPSSSKLRRNVRRSDAPDDGPVDVPRSGVAERRRVTTTTSSATKRTTRTVRSADDVDFEDGSDSDVEVLDEEASAPTVVDAGTSYVPGYGRRTTTTTAFGSGESRPPDVDARRDPGFVFRAFGATASRPSGLRPSATVDPRSTRPPTLSSSPISSSTFSESGSKALDDLNRIRARLSLSTSPGYGSPAYPRRTTSTVAGDAPKIETPYLSEFGRRLARATGADGRDDFEYKRDIIKENEAANGNTCPRILQSRFGSDRDVGLSREFKRSQEKNIFKNNVVSFTLIGIACAFFVAISFLYVGMRSDRGSALETAENVPYCNERDLLNIPGKHCVKKDAVGSAMRLLNHLLPELVRRAVDSQCDGTTKLPPFVTDAEIHKYITVTLDFQDEYWIKEDLYNLQVLVLHNSDKWGIELVETRPPYGADFRDLPPIRNADDLGTKRDLQRVGLLYKNVDLPLGCLVYNRLRSAFVSVAVVVVGFALVLAGQKAFAYYLRRRTEHERRVYATVEKIVDVLSSNCCSSDGGENYLAVNHVRDILIPIQDRKRMASVWDSAVRFVENNESRVRPEIQIVAGEQYRVWRWLDDSTINLSVNSNRSKIWQGQAFETQEGSVNSLPESPTQCLKIRHMFEINESSPNWTTVIKDTILEKCGENCRIYHIGIDKSTCCVYVKCASQKDAGIAYQNLHGWWYDGNLITVKYLRLERYTERFPDSPSSGPFLRPSSDRRADSRGDWSSGAKRN